MKRIGLIFLILMSLAAVNGFCSGKKDKKIAELERRISGLERELDAARRVRRPQPVTRDFLSVVERERIDPRELNYYLSTPLVLASSFIAQEGRAEYGNLIIDGRVVESIYAISTDTPGKLISYSPNYFQISFKGTAGQELRIIFVLNWGLNRYDIASVRSADGRALGTADDWKDYYLCAVIDRNFDADIRQQLRWN